MISKKHPAWLAALALVVMSLAANGAVAQKALTEAELKREPGFVEFGDLWKWSDGDQEMEIHLTQPLLGVVSAFVGSEDPELANLIRNLHLVRVNGFSFGTDDRGDVTSFVDNTGKKLRDGGWNNIVKMRERGENVSVFVKFECDQRSQSDTFLSGLAVLVLDDDEATFVNVVGRFRLEDIAKVGRHFDIPSANEWERFDRRGSRRSDDGDSTEGQ